MTSRIQLVLALLLIVGGALPGQALGQALAQTTVQTQTTAEEHVRRLNEALLQAMQNAESLGFQGRYDLLAPALSQTFDFEEMARAAAGSHWSKFEPAERERYVDAFTRMSVATFASRFDGYSGEQFQVVGESSGPRETKMIETRINVPAEKPVTITYVFRQTDEGWQAVDVYLESTYSEIAVKRAEYTSLLRQSGLEGLIEALDRRVADMKADSAG